MTAALEQPRDAAGRFASAACPRVYALLDAAAPEPALGEPIGEEGARTILYSPRCPHGHFRRWADAIDPATKGQPNCRACHPSGGRRAQ